ncbi:PilZ domain-containing protein [Erythrobacter sp. THAF29]|uniref:PilZ domain-containing protein n=1 Tax=Erythrobacter sp. THAF29 TaxID=2587851 RepID=UPI0015623530|nr:PilZ domain-containing protein [Erythrobacter sp. THAF29]
MGENARPLQAEIFSDERVAGRRTVRLATQLASPTERAEALIHDLSGQGLRLETSVDIEEGEQLLVELPYVGPVEAKVVWRKGSVCGCQFNTPVSQAVVSAALLRSPIARPQEGGETSVDEIEIAVSPTLQQMTEWEIEFESGRAAAGDQLLGFRQRSDGMIVAMVKKTN